MSRMNWFITAFWLFVGGMLLWEFHDYNRTVVQTDAAAPKQEHYFFYDTNVDAKPAGPSQANVNGPDVEQIGYSTENNVPSTGSFTAHVTLKNLGTAKAVDVQVMVRPYRGIMVQSGEMTDTGNKYLDDNDPLSQYGEWVNVPDLAPGDSATVDTIFTSHANVAPGNNPKPQILFGTEKAKP
jgi:hypothetical protein